MAPLPKPYISPWRKNLAGLEGDSDQIDWNYGTTDGYLRMLQTSGVGLNEAYLVPQGNIRMEAMGLDNRQPTAAELEQMKSITRREMEAGAYGLSSGLIYMPCAYAHADEIAELCKVVAEFDGVFVVHQRSEADTILASMEEVIGIGRNSGVKIHFSHFKICGRKNWGYVDQMLALIDKAKAEGFEFRSISIRMSPAARCWVSFCRPGSMMAGPINCSNGWKTRNSAKRWSGTLSKAFLDGITSSTSPDGPDLCHQCEDQGQ